MTQPEHLEALQVVAERSPEGMGVPASTLLEAGVDRETIRELEVEGLLAVVDDDGELTVAVTEAGRSVLGPRKSL